MSSLLELCAVIASACFVPATGVFGVQETASSQDEPAALSWPIDTESVAFAFSTSFDDVLAYDEPGGEPLFNVRLERHGFARATGAGMLELSRGSATIPRQAAVLKRFFGGADGLTFEAFVQPDAPALDGHATIVAYGPRDAPGLELVQERDALVCRLRVDGHDQPIAVAAQLGSAKARHVLVSASRAGVTLHVDGEPAATVSLGDGAPFGFSAWIAGDLVFGSGTPEQRGWPGRLGGVALHTRAFSAEQARRSARAYAAHLASRAAPLRTRLTAKLLAKSRVATPAEIAPYRESLSVFEYEVVRVHEGFYPPKKIRVAHWVVLDETALPFGDLAPGAVVELEVEAFADNPQLDEVHLSDTLEFDFDLELTFDAAGRSVESAD